MVKSENKKKKRRGGKVFINGTFVGWHEHLPSLMRQVIGARRRGEISSEINVHLNTRAVELSINCDSGRARRPYIVVEAGKSKLTPPIISQIKSGEFNWQKLVNLGIVEFLDAEEEEHSYISASEDELTPDHTHLEIDPVSINGVVVSVLPYSDHNSSPRITMAASMTKQSLGTYILNYNLRADTRAHIMYYPQQPLVQTRPYKILNLAERSAGQNFVVAISSYRGYNMADAVVMNRNSVDRGLGRSVFFKTYETEERRYPGGQCDKMEIPPATTTGYRGEEAYKYLGEDGIIYPECMLSSRDVLVGKTSPPRFLKEVTVFGVVEEKKRENSLAVRSDENDTVDYVLITETLGGTKLVKIRIRSNKVPEVGDKFASRHGQKGVIGLMLPQEDMPFTSSGIVPDLIINAHAIPSRMTVGHLLEMLGGKVSSQTGKFVDGTPFDHDSEESLKAAMKSYGFDEYGEETLYDGITGEQIKTKIYVGVIYYQRLHHLVSNKMHVRSRGPVQLLTRQPTEGRAREGGLRFGEMERDCLIGYGASMLLMERLLEESDKTYELVCTNCGLVAVRDFVKNTSYCHLCGFSTLEYVEISYAFKLLLDEIKSLHLFPRLVLKDKA